MKAGEYLVDFCTRRRWVVAAAVAAIAVVFPLLVLLPSLWPNTFTALHGVDVDTDPENMLSEDEAVRVFHNEMKDVLSLYDMIVVGVVNESHPEGVFNVASLEEIYALTEFARELRGGAIGEADPNAGVVEIDVIAPSTVDNIESGGLGVVRFEWLMSQPPETEAGAIAVRERAQRLPFLDGTLVSDDGKALALYVPLTSKDLSYTISQKLQQKIAELGGANRYHITGLPVAEDTFGVEMFKQMAISAPLAMAVIFVLLFLFFRKLALIISPMIVALLAVIFTMGMLVVTGQTIHIMSSMIPIFIMPIAVLDSVHILSEFFDRYQRIKDRRKTIEDVMGSLWTPMLYTSLTSTAGFASLALTPIPPVQTFGVFVALGVMAAWFFTITIVPAYVMFIPEKSLENFGLAHHEGQEEMPHGVSGAVLRGLRAVTYERAKYVLAGTVVLVGIAIYGISRIEINDNPTKWFKASHPIRVADRVLNEHFAGTYMAYLALRGGENGQPVSDLAADVKARMRARAESAREITPEAGEVLGELLAHVDEIAESASDTTAFLDNSSRFVNERMDAAEGDLEYGWEEFALLLDEERQRRELFKQPEVLEYVANLEDHLVSQGVVGKVNSLPDIVKTVHRELMEGDAEAFRIPDTANAVAQCLITYESSHRPHDLYHFVTPDYRTSSLWVQLKSGDNKDMSRVVAAMDDYVAANPPPGGLSTDWFGLTYINVVWQEKMVSGMLEAFAGSFLVVLLMMMLLFRSGLWGLLSMIPLTVTIGLIYGVIGLIGKDYDMPVAVLSSLTLGLAVDFAIHFLARSRAIYAKDQDWRAAQRHVFGEPARAILRNVIVIAVGFLPLLAAPLVPYITVGTFLASILFVSGAATLLILPSMMRYLEPWLFPQTAPALYVQRISTCVITGAAVGGLTGLNVAQFTGLSTAATAGVSVAAGCVVMGICWPVLARIERVASSDTLAEKEVV